MQQQQQHRQLKVRAARGGRSRGVLHMRLPTNRVLGALTVQVPTAMLPVANPAATEPPAPAMPTTEPAMEPCTSEPTAKLMVEPAATEPATELINVRTSSSRANSSRGSSGRAN